MIFITRTITVFFLFVSLILPLQDARAGTVRVKGIDVPESFRLHSYPRTAPTAFFEDEKGQKLSLKDFRGKILLVNVWSTACAQCVIELPMLDRLQKDMGGMKFQVIALSAGQESPAFIRSTWNKKGIKNLKIYTDRNAAFSLASGVLGLPTTFLIDDRGYELGRLRGMAEWDGPVIKAQIRQLIRQSKERPDDILVEETISFEENILPDPLESVPPPPSRENDISEWFKK